LLIWLNEIAKSGYLLHEHCPSATVGFAIGTENAASRFFTRIVRSRMR